MEWSAQVFTGRPWAATISGMLIMVVAGCSRPPSPPSPPANSAPASSVAQPAAGRAATTARATWAGSPLRGNDPSSLRAYLESVSEVTPKTFKVEWSPATVALDKQAAIRSLRGVSPDGATITLASDEPAVAKLKPGSILWVWNVTVRKVQSVQAQGDVTLVRTAPVPLNEAIPNARIEFEAPVNLSAYYKARRADSADAPTANLRAAPLFRPDLPAPVIRDFDPAPSRAWQAVDGGFLQTAADAPSADGGNWYDEGMSANGFAGEKNGWQFSVGYQARAAGITLELQARKNEASDNPAAELWLQASDNLDARIRARVDLDGFNIAESLTFSGGNIDEASTHFKNLNGKVHAQFLGRLGKPGSENFKVPVMKLPVSFNIPIPAGGIPFVVQVGTDFTLTLGLSAKDATLSVEGQTAFRGDGGFDYEQTKGSYSTNFQGDQPSISDYQGFSLGVSAVVVGMQLPRLGLGLGLIGVSSVAYVDVVNVITMTNGAAVGGLGPKCKRVTYAAVGHVGIDTEVIPLPFAATEKVSDALSPKREIFNLTREVLDPPVKMCEIK